MARTKNLAGECQRCGGHLEYPAENIGLVARCPHCDQETELTLAAPPEEPAIPRRVVVWTIVAITVLLLGLAATLAGLKRAQDWAERQKSRPTATNNLPSGGP